MASADTPLPGIPAADVAARNVVMVHGLYADGSSWINVVPHLQAAGLNVAVVQNPLTTSADAAAETRRVLALQDGPTVLVGHSWSGTIVSEAGGDDGISALVHIAARAPDAGEDLPALAKQFPTPPASSGIAVAPDGYAELDEPTYLNDFAGGVPTARARALYAVQDATGPRCPANARRARPGTTNPAGIRCRRRTAPSTPTSNATWHSGWAPTPSNWRPHTCH